MLLDRLTGQMSMAERSVNPATRRSGRWLTHLLRLDSGDSSSHLLAQPFLDYYVILASTVLLCGIGVLMGLSSSSVYSQSLGYGPYHFAFRQALFLVIGAIGAVVVSRLSEAHLRKLGGIAYAAVCLMLVLVLTALGSDAGKGNQSWLSVGSVSLQPSEFAKFALVLIGASYMSSRREEMATWKGVGYYLGLYAVVGLFVMVQGDLGTTMIIGLIMLAQMWNFGVPKRYLGLLIGLGLVAVLMFVAITPYRAQRVVSFFHPDNGATTSQQPLSAIYALATGGWWGVGIGASRQKWGGLYDGAQNDFVFAVIGEEMGLLGTLGVIVLFVLLIWAGVRTAMRHDSLFRRSAASAAVAWIAAQALINMSVSLNLLPVVGVPLPFISIGGSALVSELLAVGVLLACARTEPDARRASIQRTEPSRVTSVVDGGTRV
ncbi:putative lipid II flippase FtsW [Cutibacterium sp. WCA-380-WT-3A]|uniref:Probable peptidoglycan glycosyltransferase FtsW n=1 Tax=Cutibacterium porci TaxID=2605781 RepID=A0A7K0J797_9ACTN|nr:putative lipid II flippase FtsW [Cutibacterium porci]MSS45829.1 putative lipid II flippase FtsW [Cutibacterium porci]